MSISCIRTRFILLLRVSLGSRDVKGGAVQSRAGSGPQKAWGHKTEWNRCLIFRGTPLCHHGTWKKYHVAVLWAQEIKTQDTVSTCHNSKAVLSYTASGWTWIVNISFFLSNLSVTTHGLRKNFSRFRLSEWIKWSKCNHICVCATIANLIETLETHRSSRWTCWGPFWNGASGEGSAWLMSIYSKLYNYRMS